MQILTYFMQVNIEITLKSRAIVFEFKLTLLCDTIFAGDAMSATPAILPTSEQSKPIVQKYGLRLAVLFGSVARDGKLLFEDETWTGENWRSYQIRPFWDTEKSRSAEEMRHAGLG